MAKQINVDEIDERFIIASVKKDRGEVAPEAPPIPSEPSKEEIHSKRSKQQAYEALFIKASNLPPARFGKTIYIRKEYHDKISQIIHVIGENELSLFGYIDNVLAHHFESFQEGISQSFKKNSLF
jgi:hypothetical protein